MFSLQCFCTTSVSVVSNAVVFPFFAPKTARRALARTYFSPSGIILKKFEKNFEKTIDKFSGCGIMLAVKGEEC